MELENTLLTNNWQENQERNCINNSYEITKEQLSKELRDSGYLEIKEYLLEQLFLEEDLKRVRTKLANIKKTYEEEVARRKNVAESLGKLQGHISDEQIRQVKAKLERGDTEAAKKIFKDLVEEGGEIAGLAFYQLRQLAEGEWDYDETLMQAKKFVNCPYELRGNA